MTLRRNGFTLIELLVVIAIIAILAVAVLSAINPLEQINKGRDTQTNSDVSQLLGASERYYTNSNPSVFPWNVASATGYAPGSDIDPAGAWVFDSRSGSPDWKWVDNLAVTQEIKDAFANRLKLSKSILILHAAGSGSSTYMCYYPKSNSNRKIADQYCDTNGDVINVIRPQTCATTDGTPPTTAGTNPICVP